MTLNPRQDRLLEELQKRGALPLEELARLFGVAVQTVRRDVSMLEEAGLLARYHGGVRLPGSTTENVAYRERQQEHAEEKRAIARCVASEVPEGSSLFINIGTTTEAIARELVRHRGLRVITNNLNVARTLVDNPDCEVIIVGGLVRPSDSGVVGELAVEFINQFKVDIGLIGISGIEADGSLRDFDSREVRTARTIIDQSRQVWLSAAHDKFNRPAMMRLGDFGDIDRLFTGKPPPEPFPGLLEEAKVEVRVAG